MLRAEREPDDSAEDIKDKNRFDAMSVHEQGMVLTLDNLIRELWVIRKFILSDQASDEYLQDLAPRLQQIRAIHLGHESAKKYARRTIIAAVCDASEKPDLVTETEREEFAMRIIRNFTPEYFSLVSSDILRRAIHEWPSRRGRPEGSRTGSKGTHGKHSMIVELLKDLGIQASETTIKNDIDAMESLKSTHREG